MREIDPGSSAPGRSLADGPKIWVPRSPVPPAAVQSVASRPRGYGDECAPRDLGAGRMERSRARMSELGAQIFSGAQIALDACFASRRCRVVSTLNSSHCRKPATLRDQLAVDGPIQVAAGGQSPTAPTNRTSTDRDRGGLRCSTHLCAPGRPGWWCPRRLQRINDGEDDERRWGYIVDVAMRRAGCSDQRQRDCIGDRETGRRIACGQTGTTSGRRAHH